MNSQTEQWQRLSCREKDVQLYISQKRMLEMFLERGALSKAQFEKSCATWR